MTKLLLLLNLTFVLNSISQEMGPREAYIYLDESNTIIEKENYIPYYHKRITLNLNDKSDEKILRNGAGSVVIQILPEKTLREIVDGKASWACSDRFFDRYTYAGEESHMAKMLDVSYNNENCLTEDFFLYNGKIYNKLDFGNFLWGAIMSRLGFSYLEGKIASEVNAFFNGYKQNKYLLNEEEKLSKIMWKGDTKEDQIAIREGFFSNIGKYSPTKITFNERCKNYDSNDFKDLFRVFLYMTGIKTRGQRKFEQAVKKSLKK